MFKHLDSLAIQQMAKNTLSLCKQILNAQQLNISELQIDCDWTKSTRTNYFYFLNQLKKQQLDLLKKEELLEEDEAMFVVNSAQTVLNYLNRKFKN